MDTSTTTIMETPLRIENSLLKRNEETSRIWVSMEAKEPIQYSYLVLRREENQPFPSKSSVRKSQLKEVSKNPETHNIIKNVQVSIKIYLSYKKQQDLIF